MSEQDYDKEQLKILRNAFKAFDHDDKGFIDHSDVSSILEIIGQKLDPPAVKKLITEVDKGTSGKLDFGQFCKLAARFIEVEEDPGMLANELKEAFRVYDKEGKGYLTVETLRGILHELDDKLSNNDLDMIIEEIDADGSGTVDFDEFMQVMTGKNYYDFTVNRQFVFESCACPARRFQLHRRIEWHFERLFEQLWQPFDCYARYLQQSTPKFLAIKAANSTSEPPSCVHRRLAFRPRFPKFPKWVPILTLYREVVQNPFRRRGRYMINQY